MVTVVNGSMFLNDAFTPDSVKHQRDAEAQAERKRIYDSSHMVVISVDLGRQADASVICGLACTSEDVAVRNVEIFRRTDYATLADRLLVIKEKMPHAALAFDATGVGLGVLDLFIAKGLRADLAVTITSGNKAHGARDMTGTPRLYIPQADLVAYITRLLNTGAIQLGGSGEGFEVLNREMKQFQANVRTSGHINYAAPQGQHDDTIFSLAIGLSAYSWLYKRRNKRTATQREW